MDWFVIRSFCDDAMGDGMKSRGNSIFHPILTACSSISRPSPASETESEALDELTRGRGGSLSPFLLHLLAIIGSVGIGGSPPLSLCLSRSSSPSSAGSSDPIHPPSTSIHSILPFVQIWTYDSGKCCSPADEALPSFG